MSKKISRRQALRQMFAAGAGLALAETASGSVAPSSSMSPLPQAAAPSGRAITKRQWSSLNGDKVGLLGLGCMRFPRKSSGGDGKDRPPIDQEMTNIMVDYALAHGINYFDTASGYPGSEVATGIALSRHPRNSYFIATKLSNQRSPEKTLENGKEIFFNSLKDLKTDYIDFYLLHSLSGEEDIRKRYIDNGLLDFLIEQKKEGKIRHLGFSFHGNNAAFPQLLDNYYKWDFVQLQINYLDWEKMGNRRGKSEAFPTDAQTLYQEAAKRGIPVVVMEPIRGGALANVNDGIKSRLKERFPSLTPAGVALTFATSFPQILTTLSGMSNMEQITENVDTFTDFKSFNDEEKAFLMEMAHLYNNNPHIPCTACRYCMPCPSGVDIPGNFTVYNATSDELNIPDPKEKGTKEYNKKKKAFLNHYKTLAKGTQADICTRCKLCVPKCPQHINIPEKLEMVAQLVRDVKTK